VGLNPGSRLEELDPAHRAFERGSSQQTDVAFVEWLQDKNANRAPFFLWLERHPISTDDHKKNVNEVRGVTYMRADKQQKTNKPSKLRMVLSGRPQLYMQDLCSGPTSNTTPQLCSTMDCWTTPAKDPRIAHVPGQGLPSMAPVQGVAAYVYRFPSDFFIAEHKDLRFHHTSFFSAEDVSCAGMIVIQQGIVTAVNNNSGHYRPTKEHLRLFVRCLTAQNYIAKNAVVQVCCDKPWSGTPDRFLFQAGGHRG
jgi:hypothetical protein